MSARLASSSGDDSLVADGIEAQPFLAFATLVDCDFFQLYVDCVAAAFPNDDATIGAAPDCRFAFRCPGRSLVSGRAQIRRSRYRLFSALIWIKRNVGT